MEVNKYGKNSTVQQFMIGVHQRKKHKHKEEEAYQALWQLMPDGIVSKSIAANNADHAQSPHLI
eukprot:13208404-Ditylum_brightwellii.AAC.1